MKYSRISMVGIIVTIMILATACKNTATVPNTVTTERSTSSVASSTSEALTQTFGNISADIKQLYASKETVSFTTTMKDLPEDHKFIFELGFDPNSHSDYYNKDGELIDYKPIFDIFIDPQLTISINPSFDVSKATNKLRIKPSQWTHDPTPEALDIDFNTDFSNNWGYAHAYYLVQYRNLTTGESLSKPLVTVFTIKRNVPAPTLNYTKTNQGYILYEWSAVPGAVEYKLVLTSQAPNNFFARPMVLAETSDTSFLHISNMERTDMHLGVMNSFYKTDFNMAGVQVYAKNAQGEYSLASAPVYLSAFQHTLPSSIDTDRIKGLRFVDYRSVKNRIPIKMCDGSSVDYAIDILTDDIDFVTVTETPEGPEIKALRIPAKAAGTDIKFELLIRDYNEATLQADLQALKSRLNNHLGQAGSPTFAELEAIPEQQNNHMQSSSLQNIGDILPKQSSSNPYITEFGNYNIYASNALTAYIALHMLHGESLIFLQDFPEATNEEAILDAFFEAYYQNPLILGIARFKILEDVPLIYVEYKQNTDELFEKQQAIQHKVKDIVQQIITPEMKDIEKAFAINEYLCANGEYDKAALENALANNMVADTTFRDSFTPYGILMNNVGVCASYAASYKLLADAAGLNAVVVTGYLNGDLPHAWNRVEIDGQWLSIDVTNNDDPILPNTYCNLPDVKAQHILVEDDHYINNARLGEFRATTDQYEYYRYTNRFATNENIVPMLVSHYLENGRAIVRMNTELDHNTLQDLGTDTMIQLWKNGISEEVLEDIQIFSFNDIVFIGTITEEEMEK